MLIPAGGITRRALAIVGVLTVLALSEADPAPAFTNWPAGTVTGVDDGRGFDIGGLTTCSVAFRGTCRYTGTMYGFHNLDRTHHSGPLFRQSGDCGGGSSEQGRVSLLVRDANGEPPAV